MSMRPYQFADLNRGTLSRRESRARRFGVILSILFLGSLATAATMTSARAGDPQPADAPVTSSLPYVTSL
jgi:hypothetical protein